MLHSDTIWNCREQFEKNKVRIMTLFKTAMRKMILYVFTKSRLNITYHLDLLVRIQHLTKCNVP